MAEAQPELLAQHCTEAGLIEKAVAYWQRAGQLAIHRSAVAEGGARSDMIYSETASCETRLPEQIVKTALGALDWATLKAYLDQIALSREQLTELCTHIRRYSNLVCKYPSKGFERRRTRFLDQLRAYVAAHLGPDAANEVVSEAKLIAQIEHGYRRILDVLGRCAIGQQPAVVRVVAEY